MLNNLPMFIWLIGLHNSKPYILIEHLKLCYSFGAQHISPFHMKFFPYKNSKGRDNGERSN